jgi:hypothetical protein
MPPPPSATYERLRQFIAERMKRMVGKVHLQQHHPMRAGQLRTGGRRGAAGALPPAPQCLPWAARTECHRQGQEP